MAPTDLNSPSASERVRRPLSSMSERRRGRERERMRPPVKESSATWMALKEVKDA